MMKHFVRLFVAIGSNRSINDALDIFFLRVYVYLESLSSRSAPAVVSRILNSTAGTLSTPSGVSTPAPALPAAASSGNLHTPSGSVSYRCRNQAELQRPAPVVSSSSIPTASRRDGHGEELLDGALGPPMDSRPPLHAPHSFKDLMGEEGTDHVDGSEEGSSVPAGASVPPFLSPTSCTVANTVVNTSLMHPAAALLPLTAALAAHGGSGVVPPSSTPSSPFVAQPGYGSLFVSHEEVEYNATEGSRGVKDTAAPVAMSSASESRAFDRMDGMGLPNAGGVGLLSEVSQIVLKAIDKCYLRELCMMMTSMVTCWRELSSLTAEDHAICDAALTDILMALKAITQVLMASEDFH